MSDKPLYYSHLKDRNPHIRCRAKLALAWQKELAKLQVMLNWPEPPLNEDFDLQMQQEIEFQIRWTMELMELSNLLTEEEAQEIDLPPIPYTSESVPAYIQAHRKIISKRWIWNRFNLKPEFSNTELYRYRNLEQMLKRSWTAEVQHAVDVYEWTTNTVDKLNDAAVTLSMGISKNPDRYGSEDVQRTVHAMKTTVTQSLYEAMMGENPSVFKRGNHPVEQVSWYDALRFANVLSEHCGLTPVYQINQNKVVCHWTRNGWRLPRESEWHSLSWGAWGSEEEGLDAFAWYGEDYSGGGTHPVAQKKPNKRGLYDMAGNVYEWTWTYHPDPNSSGYPKSSPYRVVCGGCWYDTRQSIKATHGLNAGTKSHDLGFRLIRVEFDGD